MNSLFPANASISDEDAIEAEAFKAWHGACPSTIRDEQGFGCLPVNRGCAVSLPAAPGAIFNRIFGLTTSDELEEAHRWMRQRAGTKFVQLDPDSASGDVKRWIQVKGLAEQGPAWAKLVRHRSPDDRPLKSDVACRPVHESEADLFGSIICRGFGLPDDLIPIWAAIVGKEAWSCFFALDGNVPIGTGAMYSVGDRCWLGGGTVLAAFRHRGAHKALIDARVEAGLAKGGSTFVVEATFSSSGANLSYDNLRKCGFEHAYNRRNLAFA